MTGAVGGGAAVLTEVLANLFKGVVDEMAWIVHRSARTTFVKETQDFGTGLVTPAGEMFSVVDSIGVLALVGIPMRPIFSAITEWNPGDVVLTNDPYTTSGMVMHLNDIYLFKPVFVDGTLLCLAWAFLHCSDVGGSVPGSIDGRNREIFQEGLRLRPVKLYERGVMNAAVANIITDNCRIPELNWGDLSALVAALDVAENRVQRLAARYGRSAVAFAMEATLDRTEEVARSVFRSLPTGTFAFIEYFEDDYVSDLPIRLKLALTIRPEGSVLLDFTGSDPQVSAAVNLPTGGQTHHPFHSLALMELVMTRTQSLHMNAGLLRPIDLLLPEASVVNSTFPAACGMRVLTNVRIHELVLGALTQAIPAGVPVSGAGQLAVTSISFVDGDGQGRVVVANPVQGGSGGGCRMDGLSGSDVPSAALRNVPVEVLEAEAPVLVRRFGLRPDTEGAGEYRGGFGIDFAFELTRPGAVVVTRGKDRHKFAPWGAAGGLAGTTGFARVRRGGHPPENLGKEAAYRPHVGDVIEIGGGGGGGYGDPHQRDPEAVAGDVRDGLVSVERAREVYGVVLADGRKVDLAATDALRARRSRPAADSNDFDYGHARSEWQKRYGEAAESIASWVTRFPPDLRRLAQQHAYAELTRSGGTTAEATLARTFEVVEMNLLKGGDDVA